MSKQEIIYTEDDVSKNINLTNLNEIQNIIQRDIEELLICSGIYYRIFGRVKSPRSLCNKLNTGKYKKDEKLIQDVIGVRIVLYFSEDMKLCKTLMEEKYGHGEFSETESGIDNFGPVKNNGVYRLKDDLAQSFNTSILKLPVDSTFELQLKTISFEGWHEIEHDMRYKMKDKDSMEDMELYRVLNSVLASYELNDWSLLRIFNEMSYKLMEKKRWEQMLRTKFRIKIDETRMDETLMSILNSMPKEDIVKLYNCDKTKFVKELKDFIKQNRYIITYETVVYVLNNITCSNKELIKYFKNYSLKIKPKKYTSLTPLAGRVVYDGTWNPKWNKEDINIIGDILYKWCKEKTYLIFKNLPTTKEEINDRLSISVPGYKLKFKYDNNSINMFLKHMDMQRPATIWMVSAEYNDGILKIMTRYYSPESAVDITHFSEPSFVKYIRNERYID